MGLLRHLAHRLVWRCGRRTVTIGGQKYVTRAFTPNRFPTAIEHEPWLDDIFSTLLCLGEGAFVDVGANVGQTLLKVLQFDRSTPYVGFEPQVVACGYIDQFLTENRLTKHWVFPVAISNEYRVLPIQVGGTGYSLLSAAGSSVVRGFRPESFYNYSKFIYAVPGDEIISRLDLEAIAVIKIDIEGAELEAVQGLARTIEKYRPFLLFEVLNHYLVATDEQLDPDTVAFRDERIAQLEATIRGHEYEIYQVRGETELRKVQSIEPEVSSDLSLTDYAAVPESKEATFCEAVAARRKITS